MASRNIREKVDKGWIHAAIIVEILGKPADYVDEAIKKIVDTFAENKDIDILEKNIHKAKEIEHEDKKIEIFSAFAEIEFLALNFSKLIEIIYDYMPSSIEIIEPSTMNIKIEDANALLNDLATRLKIIYTLSPYR